jgi:hypothetical protein
MAIFWSPICGQQVRGRRQGMLRISQVSSESFPEIYLPYALFMERELINEP